MKDFPVSLEPVIPETTGVEIPIPLPQAEKVELPFRHDDYDDFEVHGDY